MSLEINLIQVSCRKHRGVPGLVPDANTQKYGINSGEAFCETTHQQI